MKASLYPRLALDGIRKNRRMYLPYILTCTGMVMMYYIILFLINTDTLSNVAGIETTRATLSLGAWVIAIFACIFLFYTNSFMIRRRKKEFGLYNILGMGKRNIAVILFWETLITYIISVLAGLLLGVALSKLAELLLINIMREDVSFALKVSPSSLLKAAALFAVIFLLLFLNTLRQLHSSSAVSLIKSENVGEKPPKANWFLGILGAVILAAAYYIAVTIGDPVSAMMWFFVAVVMVILATYLLMIAGSVLLCRILQKRKNYYYTPGHFVSVSSMVYRMKRNGAGLASICILATMVLVMISTTTCLYFGVDNALRTRYPGEICLTVNYSDFSDENMDDMERIRSEVREITASLGAVPGIVADYRAARISGYIDGSSVETAAELIGFNPGTYADMAGFLFIQGDDYSRMTGDGRPLGDGEALMFSNRYDYRYDTLTFNGGQTFTIKEQLGAIFAENAGAEEVYPTIILVVPDVDAALRGLEDSEHGAHRVWYYQFDTGLDLDGQKALYDDLCGALTTSDGRAPHTYLRCLVDSRDLDRGDFYSLYGGLFYLGIILSIVFIFAAVLMIYYKQLSEGYEDQARFEIMQNVGMTKKEIRRSINSQLLTVFFLPLAGAGLHLIFAFPMIRKILYLFSLNNAKLFSLTTIISFLVFALFYMLVYRITSNAYLNIVSGARAES